MAKMYTSIGSVVSQSGRGQAKVTLIFSFKELELWAKKNAIDTKKLMQKSFANACSSLKAKFRKVVQHAGGESGVPKFKNFEEFTNELRSLYGISNRPMGGKLAQKQSIGAWKTNGWQVIGWKSYLKSIAERFQDGVSSGAQKWLNDNRSRYYLHKRGIKNIPRTYKQNKRKILPQPFGDYVKKHLLKWAKSSFYKSLAKMMQKVSITR